MQESLIQSIIKKLHELYKRDKVWFISSVLIFVPMVILLIFMLYFMGQVLLFNQILPSSSFGTIFFILFIPIITGAFILQIFRPTRRKKKRQYIWRDITKPQILPTEIKILKLSDERKKEILEALQNREAGLPCPRCGFTTFSILDGYFVQPLSFDVNIIGQTLGGSAIPSIIVICNRCGYLMQHSLGVLGLLPSEEERNE